MDRGREKQLKREGNGRKETMKEGRESFTVIIALYFGSLSSLNSEFSDKRRVRSEESVNLKLSAKLIEIKLCHQKITLNV